jgi:hypothetical protein
LLRDILNVTSTSRSAPDGKHFTESEIKSLSKQNIFCWHCTEIHESSGVHSLSAAGQPVKLVPCAAYFPTKQGSIILHSK